MSKKKKKRTVNDMNENETKAAETEAELEAEHEAEEVLEKVAEQDEKPEQPVEAEAEEQEAEPEIILSPEQAKLIKAELEKLREEKDDAVHQAQRLQAEFDNYRKRNAQLAADSRDDGARDVIKQLLPVLDNFDRAMQNAPEGDAFVDGIRIIARQLTDNLAKCGLEEIEAEGQFDPNLHEAVMKDSAEGVESGMITAVFQKGYRVKGKIVRHTMVKVNE